MSCTHEARRRRHRPDTRRTSWKGPCGGAPPRSIRAPSGRGGRWDASWCRSPRVHLTPRPKERWTKWSLSPTEHWMQSQVPRRCPSAIRSPLLPKGLAGPRTPRPPWSRVCGAGLGGPGQSFSDYRASPSCRVEAEHQHALTRRLRLAD